MNFAFDELMDYNLHLIREFYANLDPLQPEYDVQIRGQVWRLKHTI